MKRIINHRDFNIFKLEKEVWDIGYHNHNFYEIIIIEEGRGHHILNGVSFSYKKGDVFLLKPSDAHEFSIAKKTNFLYIKFTNQFIADMMFWNSDLKKKLYFDNIFLKSSNHFESFIIDKKDQEKFRQIANILHNEYVSHKNLTFELTFQLFISLILLLMRNIVNPSNITSQLKENKIEQILSYITINALHAEKVKISNLAKEFSMSEKYISIYVKAQTSLSIQKHIVQIKLKAAEKLLKKSSYNINEIAEKLGFNDASHFNKFFKKHKALSPTTFQKMS